MKNYLVSAIREFIDQEENKARKIGDEFYCTKERYEYLKLKNAVLLVESPETKIEEPKIVKEEKKIEVIKKEVKKPIKKTKKTSKK